MKFEDVNELVATTYDNAEYRDVFLSEQQKADGYKAIFNTTQNEIVAIKKANKRALITHNDLIKQFVDVCNENNLSFKGRIEDDGNNVQVYAYLEDGADYKDKVKQGIILSNNYSGGTTVGAYGFRVACENGMILTKACNKHILIEKAESLKPKILSCVNAVLTEKKKVEKINSMIETAQNEVLGEEMAKQLLNILITNKQHRKEIEEILDSDSKDRENITRWELYNSITNYATHGELKHSQEKQLQNNAQKLLVEIHFNKLKQKAKQVEEEVI